MTVEVRKDTIGNFIDGQWVESQDGETIESKNPSNVKESVGRVYLSTEKDALLATTAAKNAAKAWAKLSGNIRGEYLRKTADLLEQNLDSIACTMASEMGKTLLESKGETARGIAILRYYAAEGMRPIGQVIPSSEEGTILMTSRVPLGVVALITPWNFPVAIPIWKMAPALIYGNTVVLKPALETTVTAAKVMECFATIFPAGVVNMVSGDGAVVGQALCEDSNVKAISFTGSNAVGRAIAANAVARGVKFQLEMGGKNPVIVTEHADIELAAELTVSGSMKSTGQKCTATSRAIVVADVYDVFRTKVIEKLETIKLGSPFENETYLGPVASEKQYKSVMKMIEKGKAEGATLVLGGKRSDQPDHQNGYFVEPTLFEHVTSDMSIAQDEIFGPVLTLLKVDSTEEAIAIANDVRYGLSASIFTTKIEEMMRFIQDIEVGMVRVNAESSGVELQAPFGGLKESSSYSREQGQAAIEFFTSIKTITMKA